MLVCFGNWSNDMANNKEYSVKFKTERTGRLINLESGYPLKVACERARSNKESNSHYYFFVMKGDTVIAEFK